MGGAGFEAGIASHGRSCRYCGRRGCGDWRRGSRRRRRASDADRVGVADLDSSAGEDEGCDGVALCGAWRGEGRRRAASAAARWLAGAAHGEGRAARGTGTGRRWRAAARGRPGAAARGLSVCGLTVRPNSVKCPHPPLCRAPDQEALGKEATLPSAPI